MNNNQRRILLGIFFIVALSILAFYTLFLTDIHLFSKPILMTVYFEEANDLREGDQVQLLGARIGRVKEVVPNAAADKAKRIKTVLSLESEIELKEGAEISIQETSLLGGRAVWIDPGVFGGLNLQPLEDGAFLGVVQKNPIASFGDFGVALSRLVDENRESIKGALANLNQITADVKDGKGLFGKLIADEQILSDARAILANVSDASGQLKSGQGLLGSLLYDPVAKQKFDDTLENVRKLSADLRGGEGILGALIHDTALRDRLTSGLDSFVAFGEKLNAGEGTLAMLMNDKEMREQFRTLVANLSTTSEDIRGIVADVRDGKGSLGKFLADDGRLYDGVEKAVSVATRSLEDYREAAPITAFTSVLFAAF